MLVNYLQFILEILLTNYKFIRRAGFYWFLIEFSFACKLPFVDEYLFLMTARADMQVFNSVTCISHPEKYFIVLILKFN